MSTTLLNRPLPTSAPTHDPGIRPSRIARRLAENTRLWDGVVEFDPDHRWYTRIALGRGWEAWLLSWLPDQGTEWHDHGGSAGALTVLRGTLSERVATPALDIVAGSRTVDAGDLRSFGRRHLHRVHNQGAEPAVSLHVYAPGLDEMNDYAETGDGRLELVSARRAGVSW